GAARPAIRTPLRRRSAHGSRAPGSHPASPTPDWTESRPREVSRKAAPAGRNPLKPGAPLRRSNDSESGEHGRTLNPKGARPPMLHLDGETFLPFLIFSIPIVAIVGGITAGIVRTLGNQRLMELAQRERIAAIERGVDPSK